MERRIDETVACPHDDTIVSAPPPPAIVERGKLGDTLIVEAYADKFLEHHPVERQCLRFARAGIAIAPQTRRRAVTAHIDLLMPVAALIATMTRAPGYLGTDATGIPVLDPSALEGVRTGAIWAWTNARWVSFFFSAHPRLLSVALSAISTANGYASPSSSKMAISRSRITAASASLRRPCLGRKNWLFTWRDVGRERTAASLSIIATCIAHEVNPRAYLHLVTKLIVHGFPQKNLRDLLPDRMLATHPELFVGDSLSLPDSTPPTLAP